MKVATVDSKGKVKALKKGTAKITVTVGKQKAHAPLISLMIYRCSTI